jgi:hypothetical protein
MHPRETPLMISTTREQALAHSLSLGLPPLGDVTIRLQPGTAAPRPVPERLVAVVRRALAAEQVVTGELRIPAFRLTRYLIAGLRYAGYSPARIANSLDTSVGAVRNRGGSDGWVATDEFAALADLTPETIDQWAHDGLLHHGADDETGRRYYAASELIRALEHDDLFDPSSGASSDLSAANQGSAAHRAMSEERPKGPHL